MRHRVFVTGGTGYIGKRGVPLEQMLRALAHAVDHPAQGVTVLEVPAIRAAGLQPVGSEAAG